MRSRNFFITLFLTLAIATLAVASENDVPLAVTQYLEEQGPIVKKQLFMNASRNQLIEYYCVDENLPGGENEGASNPANVHCEVALFNKESGNWEFGDEMSLGQGSVKKFTSHSVITESVEYASSDALCCPSLKIKKEIQIRDGQFINENP